MPTKFQQIQLETRGAIGWLTIARPQQLNALNVETLQEIIDGVKELRENAEVRVLVLTGAGDKAFVAGADIKAMQGMETKAAEKFVKLGHDCMHVLEITRQPVIAMVNGFALGGGMELALACDFIYAAETAVFGLPEVTLGIFPGFGGTQRLFRVVGRAKALELITSARRLSAAEALTWGLVNRVLPLAQLRAAVEKTALAIAANSPRAIGLAKQVVIRGGDVGLGAGLALEREVFPRCLASEDAKEGLRAFVEKRAPVFKGN